MFLQRGFINKNLIAPAIRTAKIEVIDSLENLYFRADASETAKDSDRVRIGKFVVDANSISMRQNIGGTQYAFGKPGTVIMCTGTESYAAIGGSANIKGWAFAAGDKFGVTNQGDLYASNVSLEGKIKAKSGEIAGFIINPADNTGSAAYLRYGTIGETNSVLVSPGTNQKIESLDSSNHK